VPAPAAIACGSAGYAYAGLASPEPVHGVGARLTALAPAVVEDGHVAAWVGVGGPTGGPGRTAEWLQVGLSGAPGLPSSDLYYEVQRPGEPLRHVALERGLLVGASRRVAVLEVAGRPDWWRVWVEGRAVSEPIELPGSDRAWRAIATVESWTSTSGTCNRFGYGFAEIVIAQRAGGDWSRLERADTMLDRGLQLTRRERSAFAATAS